MTVIFMEGFDTYASIGTTNLDIQSRWNQSGSPPLGAGRFAGQALFLNSSDAANNVPSPWAPQSSLTLGFALYGSASPTFSSASRFAALWGASRTIGLRPTSANEIEVYRDTTLLGTTDPSTLVANTWQYIEVEVVISATVGRVTIYVDGVQVINLTGVNTGTVSPTYVEYISGGSGFSYNFRVDDIYVIDSATRLGERRIDTIRANADTATAQWTPNSGTVHYNRVNATVAQTVTYNEAATIGFEDLYDFSNLPTLPATVDAVQLSFVGNKTDTNTVSLNMTVDDGSVSYGPSYPLTSTPSYMPARRLMSTRPGGGAWSASIVNSLKLGIRMN